MPIRPKPPLDCEIISEYKSGDEVYYFRNNKWRKGEIKSKGGSSDESPRYLVIDNAKHDERLIDDVDIRKQK